MTKNWIKDAVGTNRGGLHRSLGVPENEKIPPGRIEAATRSNNPKIRRQANLAKTLKGLR